LPSATPRRDSWYRGEDRRLEIRLRFLERSGSFGQPVANERETDPQCHSRDEPEYPVHHVIRTNGRERESRRLDDATDVNLLLRQTAELQTQRHNLRTQESRLRFEDAAVRIRVRQFLKLLVEASEVIGQIIDQLLDVLGCADNRFVDGLSPELDVRIRWLIDGQRSEQLSRRALKPDLLRDDVGHGNRTNELSLRR
jgi:hypothetical protein